MTYMVTKINPGYDVIDYFNVSLKHLFSQLLIFYTQGCSIVKSIARM